MWFYWFPCEQPSSLSSHIKMKGTVTLYWCKIKIKPVETNTTCRQNCASASTRARHKTLVCSIRLNNISRRHMYSYLKQFLQILTFHLPDILLFLFLLTLFLYVFISNSICASAIFLTPYTPFSLSF
jgi:hypothetical protein